MSQERTFTVKEWNPEDKPRERLVNKGKKELSDAELIAIILRSGQPGTNVLDLARKMLRDADNNLTTLSQVTVAELTNRYKGIGEAKAVSIIAAIELGYRMIQESKEKRVELVASSSDIFHAIGHAIIDLPHEEFWAIYLNIKNRIVYKQRVSSGGLTETNVDIRILLKTALEQNATAIAVAHNHPSGDLTPSKSDLLLTKRIQEASTILNIRLIDHLIVGLNNSNQPDYYSFYDNGRL